MIDTGNIITNYPLLSLLNSLILVVGLYEIGFQLCKVKNIRLFFNGISKVKYQYFFISINFILLILYPLILFLTTKLIIIFFSLCIFLIGIFKLIKIILKYLNRSKKRSILTVYKIDIEKFFLVSILVGLFLLSIAPITNADSLGYHMTVGKIINEIGTFPKDFTHFHQRLSGSGETLIAIGLAVGGEQFASIIQFLGVVSLFGIFQHKKNKKNYFLLLLIITSPLILTFISSAKPQFFYICSNSLIFYVFSKHIIQNSKFKNEASAIFFGLLVASINTQVKFSFVVTSFFISVLIFYYSINNRIIVKYFLYVAVIFMSVVFPVILWKSINFGGGIVQYFFSPLPLHISAMKDFNVYLQNVGSSKSLIQWLIPNRIGEYTNTIGISLIIIPYFLFKKFSSIRIPLLIILASTILTFSFGQKSPRFFYEIFLWAILLMVIVNFEVNNFLLKNLSRIQFVLIFIALSYSFSSLTIGVMSSASRDSVLTKNAEGYSLFKWANSVLPKNVNIISYHRSIYYSENNTMAVDMIYYVPDIKRAREKGNFSDVVYWSEFKSKAPKYLLVYGNNGGDIKGLEKCIGKLLYKKEGVASLATRNPVNRASNRYDGYIYEFNYKKVPNCMF